MKEKYYEIMTNAFKAIGLITIIVGLLATREWAVVEMAPIINITFAAIISITAGALLYGVGEIIGLLREKEVRNKKNEISSKNKVIELKRKRL